MVVWNPENWSKKEVDFIGIASHLVKGEEFSLTDVRLQATELVDLAERLVQVSYIWLFDGKGRILPTVFSSASTECGSPTLHLWSCSSSQTWESDKSLSDMRMRICK